jgi:hypothetical protein
MNFDKGKFGFFEFFEGFDGFFSSDSKSNANLFKSLFQKYQTSIIKSFS